MTGVPANEVGTVVQDFVDAGAAHVRADEEPGGTYTVEGGAGGTGGGSRGFGLVPRSLPGGPAPGRPVAPVFAAATYSDYSTARPGPRAKSTAGAKRKSGGSRGGKSRRGKSSKRKTPRRG